MAKVIEKDASVDKDSPEVDVAHTASTSGGYAVLTEIHHDGVVYLPGMVLQVEGIAARALQDAGAIGDSVAVDDPDGQAGG